MNEISTATFDILESVAKRHPELRGGFSRSTGGLDVDLVVAVLWTDWRDMAAKLEPAPSRRLSDPLPDHFGTDDWE